MDNTGVIIREIFIAPLSAAEPLAATGGHGERLRSLYRKKGFSSLLVTGPTGANVMDIQIVVIDG